MVKKLRALLRLIDTLYCCDICGIFAWCPNGSARAALWLQNGCPMCAQGRMEKFFDA